METIQAKINSSSGEKKHTMLQGKKHTMLKEALKYVKHATSCGDLSKILGRMLDKKGAPIMKADSVGNDQGVEMVGRNQQDVSTVSETCSYSGVCHEHGPVGSLKVFARSIVTLFGSENQFPKEIRGLRKKMEFFAEAEKGWTSGATEVSDTKLPGPKS